MFQDNPLLAQLKQQIVENIPKKEGTIKATERGFGFLELDDKKNSSIFIPPPMMKKVIHGDKVSALIRTDKDKESAEPESLIEAALTRFVGRVKLIKGRLNVVPDHPQINNLLRANCKKGLDPETLKEGDWVVARLTQHALTNDKGFLCRIEEKIASDGDKIVPWWVTLAKHELPNQEPQIERDWQLLNADEAREDLTALPFITIDGESTKDMDDALHTVANEDGSFTLTVAIADPTAYVAPDDEVDALAKERSFTIYLPGRNIPMLPRELSDELCSLVEGEKRPSLCCRMTITADGTILDDATFFSAWICSQGRLSYDNVSDYLEQKEGAWQPNEVIAAQIAALKDCAMARANWRQQHAVTFPDRPDYRFELDDDSAVVAIHIEHRRIANRMVEESMISANICAGRMLAKHFGAGVFNTHAGFAPEKMDEIMSVMAEAEAPFEREQLTTVEGFSALRRWMNEQPTTYWDNRLRKLQSYSEIGHEPLPHYAMGLPLYATWTSPIRKYGDMINHRMLKGAISGQAPVQMAQEGVGESLMLHRRAHKMAERDCSDWLYIELLTPDLGTDKTYRAEVFDISRGGMRVRLLENGAAAFIPAPLILANKERLECNGDKGTICIDGVVEFKLGDEIEVSLAELKPATRSIIMKPTKLFEDLPAQTEGAADTKATVIDSETTNTEAKSAE
ncbi:Exoribonuclease 2 [Vibrio stylophorae]|uniref:Exoribonuclease 2 n=1 Tax=Vibrio stylophorae TaxID=659351 RepID=A0ABN8DW56_9VIBR|nr:exoribonuclease II [Vibrio stylophorae]CAH0535720.1 Exoribonuclease 2 [Vibrio stylophorae]